MFVYSRNGWKSALEIVVELEMHVLKVTIEKPLIPQRQSLSGFLENMASQNKSIPTMEVLLDL